MHTFIGLQPSQRYTSPEGWKRIRAQRYCFFLNCASFLPIFVLICSILLRFTPKSCTNPTPKCPKSTPTAQNRDTLHSPFDPKRYGGFYCRMQAVCCFGRSAAGTHTDPELARAPFPGTVGQVPVQSKIETIWKENNYGKWKIRPEE